MNDITRSSRTLEQTRGQEDASTEALTRPTLVKALAYATPVIVTVAVAPAFAQAASGGGGGIDYLLQFLILPLHNLKRL